MATQGVLSVVRNGKVVAKLVTGSDGYQLPKLADIIRKNGISDVATIFASAVVLGVGSMGSLFVMGENNIITNSDEEVPDAYRQTFSDPRWNPRWKLGTAEYVEVVEFPTAPAER